MVTVQCTTIILRHILNRNECVVSRWCVPQICVCVYVWISNVEFGWSFSLKILRPRKLIYSRLLRLALLLKHEVGETNIPFRFNSQQCCPLPPTSRTSFLKCTRSKHAHVYQRSTLCFSQNRDSGFLCLGADIPFLKCCFCIIAAVLMLVQSSSGKQYGNIYTESVWLRGMFFFAEKKEFMLLIALAVLYLSSPKT